MQQTTNELPSIPAAATVATELEARPIEHPSSASPNTQSIELPGRLKRAPQQPQESTSESSRLPVVSASDADWLQRMKARERELSQSISAAQDLERLRVERAAVQELIRIAEEKENERGKQEVLRTLELDRFG
jgi:hypothetical protein